MDYHFGMFVKHKDSTLHIFCMIYEGAKLNITAKITKLNIAAQQLKTF